MITGIAFRTVRLLGEFGHKSYTRQCPIEDF